MAQIIIACNSGGTGQVLRDNGGGASVESWATIRAGAGTGTNASNGPIIYTGDAGPDKWQQLGRGIFQFALTSADLTGATITGITFRLAVSADVDTGARATVMKIVGATPASNTALEASDYADVNSTLQSSTTKTSGSFTIGDNDFTGNATMIALAQAAIGGYLSLGARWAADIDNTAPTLAQGHFTYISLDKANTEVIIDYTPGPKGAFLFNFI